MEKSELGWFDKELWESLWVIFDIVFIESKVIYFIVAFYGFLFWIMWKERRKKTRKYSIKH